MHARGRTVVFQQVMVTFGGAHLSGKPDARRDAKWLRISQAGALGRSAGTRNGARFTRRWGRESGTRDGKCSGIIRHLLAGQDGPTGTGRHITGSTHTVSCDHHRSLSETWLHGSGYVDLFGRHDSQQERAENLSHERMFAWICGRNL